jgi:very-short-patch-repair endonuclease
MNEKFLRQHPIFFQDEGSRRFFVADFYCAEKKLVIELDGGIHSQQRVYDQYRESIIQALGIDVLRVPNRMVEEDADRFLNKVLAPFLMK